MNIEFDKITEMIKLMKNISVEYRVIDNNNEVWHWNNWLSNPTGQYLDFGLEPKPYRNIEIIEINPFENKYIGKLVPNKLIDHTKEIINIMQTLKIEFEISETLIRIKTKTKQELYNKSEMSKLNLSESKYLT